MQQASDLAQTAINRASTQTTQAGSTQSSQHRKWAAEVVNTIFRQLKGIFPAWTTAMKTPEQDAETRRQWLHGLLEAGIRSQAQIDAGLARCRLHTSPFLPSIGQFVAWCLEGAEDDAGLPSESDARLAMNAELSRPLAARNWSRHHPAVYWACMERSTFDWKNMNDRDQRKEFSDVWANVRRMVREGFDFHAALPKPESGEARDETPAPKEVAEQHSKNLMSIFDE